MNLLNMILQAVQDFFESLFSSSSPEFKKKQQLRQISLFVKAIEPPLYRADGFLLPAFPAALHQIYTFIQPVRDTLSATIASTDRRNADRYRDFILEASMTEEQRQERKAFLFASRAAAFAEGIQTGEKIIEDQGKRFAAFLKQLESPRMKESVLLLEKLSALADFTLFDYNGFFSYFDPAFKSHTGTETTVTTPSFKAVDVAEVVPNLLDLYYLLSSLTIHESLSKHISILEARRNESAITDEILNRNARIFQAIQYLVQKRINAEILLAVIRLTKKDPAYMPLQPTIKVDYLENYRERLTEIFDSDTRKLQSDQQSGEIHKMLVSVFADRELEPLEGYTDQTSALLQEFSVLSFDWVLPLRIIKTFTVHYFDARYKQILRSVIVEGYFSNRSIQSSISTAYHYCESLSSKIVEFERLFEDNQPCSIKILTGYLTGLEKGMDFEKPLRKLIENSNKFAKTLVQDAMNGYMEVFNFSLIVIEENKKTMPEYINNIRALSSSVKNSESFRLLEKEIGVFRNFLDIMKKYAIVSTMSVPAGIAEHAESQ